MKDASSRMAVTGIFIGLLLLVSVALAVSEFGWARGALVGAVLAYFGALSEMVVWMMRKKEPEE